jgi:uncharacterized protein (DUF58 family)
MEFAEVREYYPGDDVRSIDWNVTARLGKPFIKQYCEERELSVMIACDVSGSQDFGSRLKLKKEIAVELSALFSFAALQNGDKAGLAMFSDKTELFIPPKKGRQHVLRLMRELLAHKPQGKGTDIGACLDQLNRVLKRKGILLLISDFIASGYEHSLRLAAKKHDLIPVVIEDPAEKSLPRLPAVFEMADPETGKTYSCDLSSPSLSAQLAKARSEKTAALKKLFTSLGVNWIEINCGESVVEPVVKFFRARAKRLKR